MSSLNSTDLIDVAALYADLGRCGCDMATFSDKIQMAFIRPMCTTTYTDTTTATSDSVYVPTTAYTNNYNVQERIAELQDRVAALSKKAIPRFHCEYCGTQNFEYSGLAHTPQCPNCGALMRRSEVEVPHEYDGPYYPPF